MRQRYDTTSRGVKAGQRSSAAQQSGYEWSVKSLADVSPGLAAVPGNRRVAAAIEALGAAGISGRNSLGKLTVADPQEPDEVEAILAAAEVPAS